MPLVVCAVGGLACAGRPPAATQEPPKSALVKKPQSLTVVSRYSGQILLRAPQLGGATAMGQVIREQAGYDALLAKLPKLRIQMKQPAPANDDPLLQRPAIDFARHMLVVRYDRSMSDGPKIRRVLLTHESELTVEVQATRPGDVVPMASRSDVGTYEAVVVSRTDKEPVLHFTEAK